MALPAVSFAICSCSSSLMRFMGEHSSAAPGAWARRSYQINSGWPPSYAINGGLSSFRRLPGNFGEIGGPEVRPARPGQPLRLGPPPGSHLAVIAGQKHVGDRKPLPHLRLGVVRVFEEVLSEALLGSRHLLAHNAGNEAHAAVDQYHRGKLAARKYIIADRRLFQITPLDDALVDALKAPAHNDDARPGCELRRPRLGQRRPAGRHQKARTAIACERID